MLRVTHQRFFGRREINAVEPFAEFIMGCKHAGLLVFNCVGQSTVYDHPGSDHLSSSVVVPRCAGRYAGHCQENYYILDYWYRRTGAAANWLTVGESHGRYMADIIDHRRSAIRLRTGDHPSSKGRGVHATRCRCASATATPIRAGPRQPDRRITCGRDQLPDGRRSQQLLALTARPIIAPNGVVTLGCVSPKS